MSQTQKPLRVPLVDELRGLLILYVVLYHFLYDLAVIFPGNVPWMFDPWMNTLRDCMTGCLIVISGISCNYSRSNLRRGLKTFGLGALLTVGTLLFIPSQLILFGILHFFGAAMLLYALLEKPLAKVPAWLGASLSFLLFFFTQDIYYGTVGFFGWRVTLPSFLYNQPLLYPLGFRCAGLASADYYPLLPWVFLFLCGSFLGRLLKAGRFPKFFYQSHLPRLAWIGQHTLIIYLVHQPVLYALLTLFFYLL